jgi:hypothetical protein
MARDPDQLEENSEQADEGQAQDIADEAVARRRGAAGAEARDPTVDSEHGGKTDPGLIIPNDMPDLVDTLNQMITSGRIDNGAFSGEPMMDDEEDQLGLTDREVDDDDLGISPAMQNRFENDQDPRDDRVS